MIDRDGSGAGISRPRPALGKNPVPNEDGDTDGDRVHSPSEDGDEDQFFSVPVPASPLGEILILWYLNILSLGLHLLNCGHFIFRG